MNDNAVTVSDLDRGYREGNQVHQVIRGAGLSIARGECVALLGRSGSGKSTLLNLIAGIDQPDSGRITIGGAEITGLDEPALTIFRRRQIGFVYQFFNLIPTLTVAENVALPLELNEYPRAETVSRARQILGSVGLAQRGGAYPDQLSGGEQQRVAIARALVHRPPLILADEPTGNLDQETGEQVLKLMVDLVREGGSSLLLVTHSLSVANYADRILTLQEGRLGEQGVELAW